MTTNRIGVFCSSHADIKSEYIAAAKFLGSEIGRRGAYMIYGGSRCGLMNIAASAVHAAGGQTIGAVPRLLEERNLADDADITFYCENLDDRKSTMVREADVFVALPGGIGTLDEIFTVAAANTIGYHSKKVILYNVCGFWNPLLHMLEFMKNENMLGRRTDEIITVADTPEQLVEKLFG